MYAQDSIDLLQKSGIDFKKNEEHGIDVQDFGELMITSGIVLNPDVKWTSFHSGYDFGYLLKVLTCEHLPTPENEFFELLHTFFPSLYDIKVCFRRDRETLGSLCLCLFINDYILLPWKKFLMKSCENLRGGLNQLAEDLDCVRIGPAHQAGSDSLLTCFTFFKMVKVFFENKLDDSKYVGVLYGLGSDNSLPLPPEMNYSNTIITDRDGEQIEALNTPIRNMKF